MKENKLDCIPLDKIEEVVTSLYFERKEHLKSFVKTSLNKLLKDEYPGDLIVNNILLEIFSDDELCKNRLISEIKLHQQKISSGTNNYSDLFS